MALSYPLDLPNTIGFASIEFRAINAVAYSASPFTFAGQVQAFSGQAWQADITIPPVKRDLAESWVAFLLSLRGQYGTFYLNDPLNTSPSGTATTLSITGSAEDSSVTATVNGTLKAGDWFNTPDYKLHKVVKDISSSGTMEIYPALRSSVTGATCTLTNAKGIFRLSSNETSWSINNINSYGITFGAIESL